MIQYCTASDKHLSPDHALLRPHNHHLNSSVQKLLCVHVWQEKKVPLTQHFFVVTNTLHCILATHKKHNLGKTNSFLQHTVILYIKVALSGFWVTIPFNFDQLRYKQLYFKQFKVISGVFLTLWKKKQKSKIVDLRWQLFEHQYIIVMWSAVRLNSKERFLDTLRAT